jgi:glycosyltransferase involved in cell wall biosynthesis
VSSVPARVGIVVRTKNRPWFLRRAIADICAQEYDDWEVRVVNDGGDLAAVEGALNALPKAVRDRFTVLHNDPALGRSAAANAGVRALESEFVILHDDDDRWDARFLGETVAWLDSHPEDVGVVVRTEIVYEAADGAGGFVDTARAVFWEDIDRITYSDLLRVNRFVPIAYLYRRAIHARVGYYREDVHAAEDWEFNLRVAAAEHIGFIDGSPLAFWMQRVGVGGELGNSMFALADEHARYDSEIRDEALRDYVGRFGPGLPLYLAHILHTEIPRIVGEEVSREFERRPSDMDRVRRRLRAFRRR